MRPRATIAAARRAARAARVAFRTPPPAPASSEPVRDEHPDVLLDIPSLKVHELDLDVDELLARVSLGAHVMDLLALDVGADAEIGRVALRLKGVEAQARLEVRLDNVARIVDRVMTTLERDPALLERLTDDVTGAVGAVGAGAGRAAAALGRGGDRNGDGRHARRRRQLRSSSAASTSRTAARTAPTASS